MVVGPRKRRPQGEGDRVVEGVSDRSHPPTAVVRLADNVRERGL